MLRNIRAFGAGPVPGTSLNMFDDVEEGESHIGA
jgi:hypothetical protein